MRTTLRRWLAGLTERLGSLRAPLWMDHTLADGSRHVYPLRDGIDHEASQECVCGPTPRREVCHHGAEQVYHQHHPLTQKTRRKANA